MKLIKTQAANSKMEARRASPLLGIKGNCEMKGGDAL